MSKVKIEGNASGTGTLTISAPNTNTDRNLTLPDGAGEILTNASTLSSSNLSGALPAIDGSALTGLSSGAVVQVVYSSLTNNDYGGFFVNGSTSTSWIDAQLEATITPTSSSNDILVFGHFNGYDNYKHTIFINDTTNLAGSTHGLGRQQQGGWKNTVFSVRHSPSTTSACKYTLYTKSDAGASYYIGGDGDSVNTITLMEIVP